MAFPSPPPVVTFTTSIRLHDRFEAMTEPGLQPSELQLVLSVLRQHPEVHRATLFGSRAKGTHHDRSDVDLALSGELGLLGAEAIAAELEELPLPYCFDVQALEQISFAPLLEHIERVGVVIYAMAGTDSDACGQRAYNPSRAGCDKGGQP